MVSRNNPLKLWKLVERENAVRYMMISLLSFIATVCLVRGFLALTGYPQIGTGTLHIAHVLWGGLVLYLAAILPLIYLNPRLHTVGAILSGVGVGLFIDEVGKFITQQNDYFFPAAAPIIYVFFLLLVILLVMIRRPEELDGRAEIVQALEIVREELYRPLEATERAHLEQELGDVFERDPDRLHRSIAGHLLEILQSDQRTLPEPRESRWFEIRRKLDLWLTEKRLIWLLGLGMTLLGVATLKHPIQTWLERINPKSFLVTILNAHIGKQIIIPEASRLEFVRIGLEIIIGLFLLTAVVLLAIDKKRLAVNIGFLCLLVSLAVLDMLLFYFEQFSTGLTVMFQFIVLFGVIYYRNKYLRKSN